MTDRLSLALKFDDWPPTDRVAWNALFGAVGQLLTSLSFR